MAVVKLAATPGRFTVHPRLGLLLATLTLSA